MRYVQQAVIRPARCAFIPFIGGNHPKGYFDFGTEALVMDQHIYCSVVAAEQMAAAMGWAPSGDAVNLRRQLRDMETALEQAREERDALQARFDAIDVLASHGFVERKKPGRKVAA